MEINASTSNGVPMQTNVSQPSMDDSRLSLAHKPESVSSFSYFDVSGRIVRDSLWQKSWSDLWAGLDRFLCGGAQDRCYLRPHSEDGFRYLLDNEFKRSERSGRSFRVLLAYLTAPNGSFEKMGSNVASKLLAALSRSLRETDYIGWYRDGHIVGGVLTALGDCPTETVVHQIEQRLVHALEDVVLVDMLSRLRVRLCHYHELEEDDETITQSFMLS